MDKSLENEIEYLEDRVYIDNLKYNLYKKDLDRIENKLLYEVNDKKEIYLNKKSSLVKTLYNNLKNNKKRLLTIKEENDYRKMLKK